MIKKLWLKFIAISMGALGVILLLMLGAIYLAMTLESERQIYETMALIAAADGDWSASEGGKSAGQKAKDSPGLTSDSGETAAPRYEQKEQTAAQPYDIGQGDDVRAGIDARDMSAGDGEKTDRPAAPKPISYFAVLLDEENVILRMYDKKKIAENLGQDEVNALIDTVLQQGKHRGQTGAHQYLLADKPYGKIIVFSDRTIENNMLSQLMQTCLAVGFLGIAVLLVVVTLLTRAILRPVQNAFVRQKQFISDASHELKTPLSVISASTDVLEAEIGANKWLAHIRASNQRMNALVHELLSLARLEQPEKKPAFARFDLSRAVMSAALPFESAAYESGKRFELDIAERLTLVGAEVQIRQLVSILTDNAFKYADEGGLIRLSLTAHGNKKILRVYNTGAGLDPSEYGKIFERFYRSDASRSRDTGGYGLGLAIAKTIVAAHKGHIRIEGESGRWIAFIVSLS